MANEDDVPKELPYVDGNMESGPCLAAGCAAILIPSELASITCLDLADVCREVGLPPGVLNVLTGLGPEAGAPLASHPHVDKIAFMGSAATGSKIMTVAAQLVKPVTQDNYLNVKQVTQYISDEPWGWNKSGELVFADL